MKNIAVIFAVFGLSLCLVEGATEMVWGKVDGRVMHIERILEAPRADVGIVKQHEHSSIVRKFAITLF